MMGVQREGPCDDCRATVSSNLPQEHWGDDPRWPHLCSRCRMRRIEKELVAALTKNESDELEAKYGSLKDGFFNSQATLLPLAKLAALTVNEKRGLLGLASMQGGSADIVTPDCRHAWEIVPDFNRKENSVEERCRNCYASRIIELPPKAPCGAWSDMASKIPESHFFEYENSANELFENIDIHGMGADYESHIDIGVKAVWYGIVDAWDRFWGPWATFGGF